MATNNTKKRRAVSLDGPRYPDGQAGRRAFLRDLGLGAAAIAALPLAACATDNNALGFPRMPAWQIADHGGVAPPLDAAIDQALPDLDLGSEQGPDGGMLGDGAADAHDDSRRSDGGIPDGAGADADHDGGSP
jgi:hypothetical protein